MGWRIQAEISYQSNCEQKILHAVAMLVIMQLKKNHSSLNYDFNIVCLWMLLILTFCSEILPQCWHGVNFQYNTQDRNHFIVAIMKINS